MDHHERTAVLEATLTRQLSWIQSADSKAAFTFAFNTAMLGMLAAVAPKSIAVWTITASIWTAIALLFFLGSLISLTVVSYPRTDGPRGSLIFSLGIAQRSIEQYRQAIQNLTIENYIEDLAAQCHRNAEIANTKYSWVRRALISLYLSVLPWTLAIWQLYSSPNH